MVARTAQYKRRKRTTKKLNRQKARAAFRAKANSRKFRVQAKAARGQAPGYTPLAAVKTLVTALPHLRARALSYLRSLQPLLLPLAVAASVIALGAVLYVLSLGNLMGFITLLITVIFCANNVFTLMWMFHSWNNLEDNSDSRSPETFLEPTYSFTALLPARHEEKVIRDTILAVNAINYPEHLKEILVLIREDDVHTLKKVEETIAELGQDNIRLVTFNTFPINKPHSLNHGLKHATKEVIGIFDAEDEPHPDLYQIINTIMLRDGADVVQSGVQLMNYRAPWFAALNVLEYFFWFRSGLPFFVKLGEATPLGGNTVFFRKKHLETVGGWDETCLTEDADLGIRLAGVGAKVRIVYDERHATQEETPDTTNAFIKQRTRWNQGFLQILLRGDWKKLPTLRQRLLVAYILFTSMFQCFLLLSFPLGIVVGMTAKLPVGVALFSFTPFFMLILQITAQIYGLFEFTRAYKRPFYLWLPLVIIVTYLPYQLLLGVASMRAVYRTLSKVTTWEKTAHINAHRQPRVAVVSE